ncbi:fumarylacetoacetate hydrolase family protein [Lachnospiraceae bacterium C1.1]
MHPRLKVDTIIATGTPGGVAMGMKPLFFLKEGDVVRCVIEDIGELINTVGLKSELITGNNHYVLAKMIKLHYH